MAQNHLFGRNGFHVFTTTATLATAGSGSYTDVEGWGPLTIIADTVFNASTTVLEGDAPDTTATYSAGTIIYSIFTALKFDSGTFHGQRIEELDDF